MVGTLAESGLAAPRLVLEIAESVLMDDPLTLLGTLQALRDLGVGISVDDVGTGCPSLLHLKRLPVTELKIDAAFVSGLGHDVRDDAMVRALTCLGLDLGLDVVAEGVETADQSAALTALGCPRGQGFLLGRPVPVTSLRLPG